MCRGLIYHRSEVENTMDRVVDIPCVEVQNAMVKGFDISWVRGGQHTIDKRFDMPWIRGTI